MVVTPEKWCHSQVGFRGSNASGGRIVLLPAAFWVHVLPKWPLWAHLFYSVFCNVKQFQSLGGHASARRVSHEPCFRQTKCFVQGPLRFLHALPNPTCARSHIWGLPIWGVAKGSSISWVAKFNGDKISECKLSTGRSRSYKVINLLLSAGIWVVAKLQGDKSASQSSMELITHGFLDPSALPDIPCPSFPWFLGIPCFFSLRGFPCFFDRFSLLFQAF